MRKLLSKGFKPLQTQPFKEPIKIPVYYNAEEERFMSIRKDDSKQDKTPTRYLGTVYPAEQAFLEELAHEHNHKIWFNFSTNGSVDSRVHASVLSEDENLVKWVEWCFVERRIRINKLKKQSF